MSTPKEATVEDYLVARVKALGGIAIKLNPRGYKGIPDRLVVLPNWMFFCELKRPKRGRVAPLQQYWARLFKGLGHAAFICPTKESIDEVLDAYDRIN